MGKGGAYKLLLAEALRSGLGGRARWRSTHARTRLGGHRRPQTAWRARPRASAAASEHWEQHPRPCPDCWPTCEVSAGSICGAPSSRVGACNVRMLTSH
eukprot:7376741-Prymnesium_polylepis.1